MPQDQKATRTNYKRPSHTQMLAPFDISEVVYGQLLGAGGFSDVHEVKGFEPLTSVGESVGSSGKLARAFMTKHAKRENSGESRYAIKFLQRGITYDRKQFNMAAQDLKTEAEILSKVNHPNIVKIRGAAIGGAEAYLRPGGRHDSHFLLLDKLNGTLDRRLENWKKLNKKLNHPLLKGIVDKKGLKRKQLLTNRLQVAADLASAFEYLHDNDYIYRDLKPSNVGFNVRDDVTLFDFGLARKMPQGKGDMDDAYEMSGHVGTLRYMAPEVSKGEAYNQAADVYSFALLLHEIISLQKPFANMTRGQHKEQVAKRGLRPTINRNWSLPIQDIIERGWSANFSMRPSMKEIHQVLQEEICSVNNWDLDSGLVPIPSRRRSTFVFESAGLPSRKSILCIELTAEESARIKEDTEMLLQARRGSLTRATLTNKVSVVSRAA